MSEFYRAKMQSLDGEIRLSERKHKKVTREKEVLNLKIQNVGRRDSYRNRAEIVVQVSDQKNFTIQITYLVYGLAWKPFYDLRVNSDKKNVNVTYSALVRQNTGESWKNISLSFSTARPNISGQMPELSPWHLSEFKPAPRQADRSLSGSRSTAKSRRESPADFEEEESAMSSLGGSLSMNQMMAPPEASLDSADRIEPIPAMAAAVENRSASVVFKIPDAFTVENDNEDHKASIMIYDFKAHFRYSSVPKLAPYAYLKANAENSTEYPFLPGRTNIYLDNNFVSNARMDLVAPGEKFWAYLGIDESMKVEYKFLKKEKKESGLFSKSNKFLYNYTIEITNNKKTKEEIVVWDQLPISNNEKIVIKLLEPPYKDDTDNLKMNEFKYLEWFYAPEPGEKILIPFQFSVEYPSDMRVVGT